MKKCEYFEKEPARAAELQVLMFISPRQPSLHSTWIDSQASFPLLLVLNF